MIVLIYILEHRCSTFVKNPRPESMHRKQAKVHTNDLQSPKLCTTLFKPNLTLSSTTKPHTNTNPSFPSTKSTVRPARTAKSASTDLAIFLTSTICPAISDSPHTTTKSGGGGTKHVTSGAGVNVPMVW